MNGVNHMSISEMKTNRKYGYDILINNFEHSLKQFLSQEVFLIYFGKSWIEHIPSGIFQESDLERMEEHSKDAPIEEYFDQLTLLQLKQMILTGEFFNYSKPYIGELGKEKFDELFNSLNKLRRNIAHAKISFSSEDLESLKDLVISVCNGPRSNDVVEYIKLEKYKLAAEVPKVFYEDYDIPNNLPYEDFDLDGGFVGRDKEIRELKKLLYSNQDRIITIIGAGGVGKSATAIKLSHEMILDQNNPFDAIMWFSAKENKLTDTGIVPLDSGIKSEMDLLKGIAEILDSIKAEALKSAKATFDMYRNFLYDAFSNGRVLLIVDNLETILYSDALIEFIKDIPRPSQVLTTSRKGLGEIERRYQLGNLNDKDALRLFRLVSRERNRKDLVGLSDSAINNLCFKVRNYPLLIKWSIGQVCLGKEINIAFSVILEGNSEIAQFAFNDVFSLLSPSSKTVLFSIIVYENKRIRKPILANISKLGDDDLDNAIKELQLSSFIISEVIEGSDSTETVYYMLDLTMGFVETKLQNEVETLRILQTNKYHLEDQIQNEEIAKSAYAKSLFSLGVKTDSDKIAFTYIKSAKNYQFKGDLTEAEKLFKEAIKYSPNFSYALIEYSKFEFERGFIRRALELIKKAVDSDDSNFHSWFTYGKMLRKNRKYSEAVSALKQAKKLNPEYLPIYNELGRTYTFLGEYDYADAEFHSALIDQKYPNIRHKIITLQYLANNFKRKAEACRERKDLEGELNNFKNSLSSIDAALELSPRDIKLLSLRSSAYVELGVVLCKTDNLKEGISYLYKVVEPIRLGNSLIDPINPAFYEACYYLVVFAGKGNLISQNEMKKLVSKGKSNCVGNPKWENKFKKLGEEKNSENFENVGASTLYGYVKFYNYNRIFGLIESGGQGYLFFPNSFKDHINKESLIDCKGRYVCFIPGVSDGKNIATLVSFKD